MIFDKLVNLDRYLKEKDWEILYPVLATLTTECAEGRYEVSERIYIKVMSYDAKPKADCAIEAHDDYIDIQSTLCGSEGIGVYDRSLLSISEPYNKEKDVVFFCPNQTAKIADIDVNDGYFIILFPDEAHSPKQQVEGKESWIKKFVIKVHV